MIVSVISLKGGTGKTTITMNLAAALNGVVVDADIQGSCVEWGCVPVKHWPLANKEEGHAWIRKVKALPDRWIFIDCPPYIGEALKASLLVCGLALIPCQASGLDISATGEVLSMLKQAKKLRDGKPGAMIVPSRIDGRTAAGREISESLAGFGVTVAAPIYQHVDHAYAFLAGKWIGEYAPNSKAHNEILKLSKKVKSWQQKNQVQRRQ